MSLLDFGNGDYCDDLPEEDLPLNRISEFEPDPKNPEDTVVVMAACVMDRFDTGNLIYDLDSSIKSLGQEIRQVVIAATGREWGSEQVAVAPLEHLPDEIRAFIEKKRRILIGKLMVLKRAQENYREMGEALQKMETDVAQMILDSPDHFYN